MLVILLVMGVFFVRCAFKPSLMLSGEGNGEFQILPLEGAFVLVDNELCSFPVFEDKKALFLSSCSENSFDLIVSLAG